MTPNARTRIVRQSSASLPASLCESDVVWPVGAAEVSRMVMSEESEALPRRYLKQLGLPAANAWSVCAAASATKVGTRSGPPFDLAAFLPLPTASSRSSPSARASRRARQKPTRLGATESALSAPRILVVLSARHHSRLRTFSAQSQYSRRRPSLRACCASASARWAGVAGSAALTGGGGGARRPGREERRRGRCEEARGRRSRLLCISARIEGAEETARLRSAPRDSTTTESAGSPSRSIRSPIRFLARRDRRVSGGRERSIPDSAA